MKFNPDPKKSKGRFSVERITKLIIFWYILIKLGMLLDTKLKFDLHLKNVLDNVNKTTGNFKIPYLEHC